MPDIDNVKAEFDAFPGIAWSSCADPKEDGPGWVKFGVEKSELGWRTLEFLAWVMADMCRAGERLRFFPTAPPPYVNEPGQCLSFVVEIYPKDGDDTARFLKVAEFVRWCRTEHWAECAP